MTIKKIRIFETPEKYMENNEKQSDERYHINMINAKEYDERDQIV